MKSSAHDQEFRQATRSTFRIGSGRRGAERHERLHPNRAYEASSPRTRSLRLRASRPPAIQVQLGHHVSHLANDGAVDRRE